MASETAPAPTVVTDPQACVEYCLRELGQTLVVGAPLALGKPNHLLNAFYRHARQDPETRLDIFTALSLNPPKPGTGLQRRFLEPFLARHFGDYPRLDYLEDLDRNSVPANVNISEFYFRSGSRLGNAHSQRHYVSSNYTHVARDMQARGVNVLVQMVGIHPQRPDCFSLSCNPDITLELVDRMAGKPLILIAQINPDLPYMEGDAEVPRSFFQLALQGAQQPLFAVPRMAVSDADYLIGLYASALVRDCGTLQLGIGSLGDAVAYFLGLRQTDNARYREIFAGAEGAQRVHPETLKRWGGTGAFEEGLYAASEMFMDGFLHLYDSGVLKRRVYDHAGLQALLNEGALSEQLRSDALEVLWERGLLPHALDERSLGWLQRFGVVDQGLQLADDKLYCPDGSILDNRLHDPAVRTTLASKALGTQLRDGALLHAAFFLGSHWMYDRLNGMTDEERRLFRMTRVSRINQLYRGEELDRAQRLNARCINTTMKATLLGAAVSDQLADGQVVSGVGGQYNFVAMAHALDGSRSLLMLRSTRGSQHHEQSNIVWEYPHATIPRHLRDIVISEYGVADLRGTSDEETIQRLLCITDSRWQEELRTTAVAHHKLSPAWRIPHAFRDNSPTKVKTMLAPFRQRGVLVDYPTGSDFTAEEIWLARALLHLRQQGSRKGGQLRLILAALGPGGGVTGEFRACLERMQLQETRDWREVLERRVLCLALKRTTPMPRPSSQNPKSST